ncbi:phosphoribosylanthranilate isomerase, partial [bacterium]|nr:phosphoribosylanthranilate isomerase [bacterium]
KKNVYGGTGKAFDHDVLKHVNKKGKKIIVAGGVSEDNIENILKYSPFGVDINSSIETSPGMKDYNKMKNIIDKIRDLESKNG